jgi:hypothetical protein
MAGREISQEEIKRRKESCRKILDISKKIRYIGMMNKFGRTLAGQLREGVTPLFQPEEARNENFLETMRNELRKNFETSIGKTEYTYTENQKVKILTLSDEDNFYYITIDKDTEDNEVKTIIKTTKALIG